MDIEIVGRHALLFDDDTTAAFVNSQDALVDWNSLLIDRYDVRHLLFSPPPSRRRRNPQTSHSTSADAEIDYERYLDLPSPSEEEEADPKPEPVGGFNAVPFSYGNNEESNDQKNAEAESEVPAFHPPFPVPESLVQNLMLGAGIELCPKPPTEKVHQIISRTALFVSKNGGQSEIVLRVKQGDNPTFGFLMPDHHLHPYFRFLVNHKDLLQSNEEKTSNTENPTGALSLLGSVYGTGEDDDNGTEHPSSSLSGKEDVASWKTKTTILPAGKDESVSKQSLDDAPIIRKNSFPNAVKAGKTSIMRKGESSTSSSVSGIRASSLPPIPKTELMVMDPPSDMKKLVEKIVEFIIKNGRQFEGVLMEQDRGHGRFPFLIPSNIFHPYYLKVLHTAHESKSTVKSFHNEKGNASHKKMLNSRDTEASLMESDDIPLDSDRKEKFKMVMNKSRKEASDPPSKPTQEQSVQVDAAQAAAILQAATRGIKHPNLGILNGKFGGQQQQSSSSNVNETDSNEQKLKAERLKRAKMFVAMLKSGTNQSKAEPTCGLSAEPQVVSIDKKIKSEKEHLDDEKRSKRKYRDRSSIHNNDIDDVDEGDEREEKRSSHRRHKKKKKHRSHESEERHRSHHSTSHKHDDVDKNNEKKDHKRKKKHRSSSSSDDEDEHEYEHSRRKHRSHKSSSSHKHRKSRSHSSRHKHKHTHDDGKASNSEEGEMSSKRGHVVDNVSREASVDVSSSAYQEQKPQPSQITEVPDDLRAKIRAMLMSTM